MKSYLLGKQEEMITYSWKTRERKQKKVQSEEVNQTTLNDKITFFGGIFR